MRRRVQVGEPNDGPVNVQPPQVEGAAHAQDFQKQVRTFVRRFLLPIRPRNYFQFIFGFLFIYIFYKMCSITVVPAGHVGVVDFFGNVADEPLQAGLNFVNPLTKVVLMSIQTQIFTMSEDVPTKEGMDVHLEAAVLVNLLPERAVEMYKTVGEVYSQTVITPQFRSILRSITSGHEAKDLYTAETRAIMSKNLHDELTEALSKRGFQVHECPLKKLELPQRLQDAIEEKLRAEQSSQMMQFVLQKQEQEAERQIIEAKGIAEYQRIVSAEIGDRLLRWKGIEATTKLASSPNAKVVIIGSGTADGLPLILNPSESAPQQGYQIKNMAVGGDTED